MGISALNESHTLQLTMIPIRPLVRRLRPFYFIVRLFMLQNKKPFCRRLMRVEHSNVSTDCIKDLF